MRKIKYGKFLLLLIFAMSIVYSGGDVGSSKVVHADETTETIETTGTTKTTKTTYKDFYNFDQLPESNIDLSETFELIKAEKVIGSGEIENYGPSLDLPDRPDVAIITQDEQWQFGGLWYRNPIDMEKDFSMLMYVNLGDKWNNGNNLGKPSNGEGGGDGITFTIQGHTNTSGVALENTIGANGAGLGAYSKDPDPNDPFNDYRDKFISNALVLEFDTFYNNLEKLTHDNGTPNFGNGIIDNVNHGAKFYGHIDLTKTPGVDQGQFYKQHDTSELYFRSPDDEGNQDLTDNRWRKVKVSWDSSTYELTYDIAGYRHKPIVYKFDNLEHVDKTFGGTKVYWGFTGSTGDSHNLQQVGIFEVPDQTKSSIEKLARNITKDGENAEFTKEAIMKSGDRIEYQVTVDYPEKYITQEMIEKENTQEMIAAVIEDKLPAELNYVDGSLRVQKNDSDVTPTPDWNKGKIDLGNVSPGSKFVVTYKADVTKEGVIDNTATFYSKYTNPISDTAQVYSGSINILKVNETDQPLEGATFKLQRLDENGKWQDVADSSKTTGVTGELTWDYLEPGDYTITETKAPDGYLLNNTKIEFEIEEIIGDEQPEAVVLPNFPNYKEPDVFKEQRDVNEIEWGKGTKTLVGETVDFRLSAIAPTDIKEFVKFALSDQIDARLNYTAGSTTVYITDINDVDTPLVVGDDYTLTEPTDGKLEVSLTADGIAKLTAGDKLYVEFSAVVNESALGAGPIDNTAIIDWDNNKGDDRDKESEPTITTPEEGKLTITKVAKNDNDNYDYLEGATFKLQRLDENGEWQDVADSSQTTDETGVLTWDRLVSGEYRLVETEAPGGYNLLANPIEFIIDDGENLTHDYLVENIPQEVLPQTGGIGTVVFTITGLLLMMSAGLSSLITRIKKNNYIKGV